MRWGILGARVSIILVNLIIVIIILMSVLPMVSGGLQIDFPEDMEEPSIEGNVVRFSIPIDVYNGGYFDISGFQMSFRISNDGILIAQDTSDPTDIVTGRTTRVNVVMEMDLDDIPTTELSKLVFEQSTLDLTVGVEAAYTLGLVRASVHIDQSMDWSPLISDLAVDTSSISVVPNGTSYDLVVPYSFRASDMISGDTVGLAATLRNSTAQLSSASQTIALQDYNSGQIRFTIDQQAALWLMAHPEDLTIGADLSYMGTDFHQDYTYHWEGMP